MHVLLKYVLLEIMFNLLFFWQKYGEVVVFLNNTYNTHIYEKSIIWDEIYQENIYYSRSHIIWIKNTAKISLLNRRNIIFYDAELYFVNF